jgi:UDP-N-acetylglucosamine--N-acetylmuramyl-(pentapeptide) pyrophosphoryl-undecaprenol N-acetylglucosamine transferase
MHKKQYRVLIAGGGTGGHVFPAIAIAGALKRIVPGVQILFVGALGKMEMEKVPAAGFEIKGLPVAGLQRKLSFKNLTLPFRLMACLRLAKKIVREFNPDVVVGVGGYASWPVARTAVKRKIPLLIQEQNSYPGLTNRMLASKASKICVAYPGMEKYFPKEKIFITGNPVRPEIKNTENKKNEALNFFNLNSNLPVLLVVGGSLGALTINKAVHASLNLFLQRNIQLIWQTGSYYYGIASDAVDEFKDADFKVLKFIERMDLAYAAADIVVSRAGAIAVSELCLVRKPVILIPSPNVAEDHQTKNAMALVNANAGILIPDNQAVEKLGCIVSELFDDEERQHKLQLEIARLGFDNADETIVHEIVDLFK